MAMGRSFRRLFCTIFCTIFLLQLSACGGGAPPPAPARFTAEAAIEAGGAQFTAQLRQEAPGILELCFTAPEELCGMELRLRGDAAELRFGALQQELLLETLPAAGFAPLLNQVLLLLAQPLSEGFSRLRGSGWAIKGMLGQMSFSAELGEDGALKRLEVPAAGVVVVISDLSTTEKTSASDH